MHLLFQHNVPPDHFPASLSSSSASIDPTALELRRAFTSAHAFYPYHRGQSGSDGQFRPLVVAIPVDFDDQHEKYGLPHPLVVVPVADHKGQSHPAVVAVAIVPEDRHKKDGLHCPYVVVVAADHTFGFHPACVTIVVAPNHERHKKYGL